MSRLDIQQYNFDWMIPGKSYVMISVACGEKNKPYRMVRRIMEDFRRNSSLCGLLDRLHLNYDIMPVMVDDFNGSAAQIDQLEVTEEMLEAIEEQKFGEKCEAAAENIVTDHSQQGFGFETGELTITFEDMPKSKDVEITYSHSEDDEMVWVKPEPEPAFSVGFATKTPHIDEDDAKDMAALDDVLDNFLPK